MKALLIINIDESQEPRKWVSDQAYFDVMFLNYSTSNDFKVVLEKLYGCWWFDFSRINKGKWKNIKYALDWMDYCVDLQYTHFWFPDPDLEIEINAVAGMLQLAERCKFPVFQPALTYDSKCSHQFLKAVNNSQYRKVEFVEIMCPGFSFAALKKNSWTFDLNYSGYGIDLIWGRDNDCYVIDAFQVRHCRAPSYQQRAIERGFPDPIEELEQIKKEYLK